MGYDILTSLIETDAVVGDLRRLIVEARQRAASAVNRGLTALYWQMGRRIQQEIIGTERAAYGEQIVVTVSRQLVAEYGRGYSEKNLRRMVASGSAIPAGVLWGDG